MRSLTFPYLSYRGYKAPIIALAIKAKKEWRQITAYVDSGASCSIFKTEEAERLNLNFKTGKKDFVRVGDGSYIPIYVHRLPVQIGDEEFIAAIAFSPELGVGFNLLGRKDIFSRFDISFSDAKETVTFTPVKKS